jgi:hypothetical protein
MKVIKNQKLNKKVIFCLIVFIFCSISSFSQGDPWGNPEGAVRGSDPISEPTSNNNDATKGTGIATPLDNSIWILLALGLTLGAFKMQSKKEMQ